jgi:aspartate/methionine/tyrosine aminotransferase
MPLKTARRAAIPPFIVMDVLRAANERAATGADVLHLELGQPGTGAPEGVLKAAHRALDGHGLGYTDSFGLKDLRQRIARDYHDRAGIALDWQRVVVTTGSSGAFILAFLAAFDVGDRVALAVPCYPAYRNILRAFGIEVVEIPCGPDSHFQPTPEHLRAAGPVQGLIVASPSNPTGSMLTGAPWRALIEYCEVNAIRLVSDEIYHGITFAEPAETALLYSDTAVVVNSFSKYYSMTGWRLGWLVLPEDLCRPVECLSQSLFISPPTLSQIAALSAFDCTVELDGYVRKYAANRDLLLAELPHAGITQFAPADGAFYLYADIGHLTNDSSAFCQSLLAETGVALTPGIDFDPARGTRTVRIAFAGPPGDIAEAAARIGRWLR